MVPLRRSGFLPPSSPSGQARRLVGWPACRWRSALVLPPGVRLGDTVESAGRCALDEGEAASLTESSPGSAHLK